MIFRIYHQQGGAHVHCSLFVGQELNMTFAKAGDFVLSSNEFQVFKILLENRAGFDFQDRHSSEGPAATEKGEE